MATKEVKVKSYTRKTKSGKSVIVRAHTAKHKCSDKGCGSGEELLKKRRSPIKERFDAAAKELLSRPDPKDMSDEDVIKEWESLRDHFGTDHYKHYTERKMRTKDWSKRVNKLRPRYNEALNNQRKANADKKAEDYMKSRGISREDVEAYAKKVGYTYNENTGGWHFRNSRVPHPLSHVAQKAVALRKKHNKTT